MHKIALLGVAGMLWLGLAAGCSSGKGAVSFGWQLLDATTGGKFNSVQSCANGLPGDAPGGACCVAPGQSKTHDVPIDHVLLRAQRLADVDIFPDGGASDVPCGSCCALNCNDLQHTTSLDEFDQGTYRLSLVALRCGLPVGDVPPAVVRQINPGEIVNLNIVEIRIDPQSPSYPTCAGTGGMVETGNSCPLVIPDAFPIPRG